MTDNKVRLSQVVGVYGPGAMLDLPDRSVLVMGLDHWDMKGKDTFKPIEEPRLQTTRSRGPPASAMPAAAAIPPSSASPNGGRSNSPSSCSTSPA